MRSTTTFYKDYSDDHLFKLIKQDDKKAFEEIYNRYWSYLLDYAFKPLQSRQKAEDLVQEIFISLYQRRHGIDFSVSLKAYLTQAIKFKVLNEYRSQSVRENYQKALFFKHNSKNDFACSVEIKELEQSILKTINVLPEKCKQVFLLSRQEEFSYKEISGGLGISVSTVEKHISKALKVLKTNLCV